MIDLLMSALGPMSVAIAIIALGLVPLLFRRVVEPNEVHIVQSRKKTVSYGKDKDAGGAYYEWPSWVPLFGVQVVKLKISVFDLDLRNYEAYDVGRVPFVADVVGFFRISDSNKAAERVSSQAELEEQLMEVLRGATRAILAQHDIEEIMTERSKYGRLFTEEVKEHLAEWGVEHVKSIELMDIRDPSTGESHTIRNIMAKKQSLIDKQSRVEVAANQREAEVAEVDAERDVDLRREEARQAVGQRKAQADREIGIADEQALQEIKEQKRTTAEKDMAVRKVEIVRAADIAKDAAVVKAEEDRETTIIRSEAQQREFVITAEGEKQKQILIAEGARDAEKARAEGVLAVGTSEAEAKRLMELAPVNAQIELAREIGENEGYQEYLIKIRNVEKEEKIGVEQAGALKLADIRIIANGNDVTGGLNSVGEIFSSSGGTKLGAMIEGIAQSPTGQQMLKRFGIDRPSGELGSEEK